MIARLAILQLMLLAGIGITYAQKNDHVVIRTRQAYQRSAKGKPAKEMVDLQTFIPGLQTDIRYATTNNCTGTKLYKQPKAYLRKSAASALKAVQEELAVYHTCIVIFDAYRPLSVTQKIWNVVHDERYAARPGNGSGHNRGLSVDLSLIDMYSSSQVDMGTDFDSFSDSSAYSFAGISANAKHNRKVLHDIMVKHGFKPLSTEWWHFSWPDTDGSEVMDITFEDLLK